MKSGALNVVALLAIAGVFVGAVYYANRLYAPCDDTYIYLVYVKNLFAGHGLTFNGMQVQGFTSILWVGLLALGGLVTTDLPVVADRLSMASGCFALLAVYVLARRMGLNRIVALLAPVLLATTGDFAFYMGNGLETVLFTALVSVACWFLVSSDRDHTLRSPFFALVLALMFLGRPEGALVGLVIIVYLGWRGDVRSLRRGLVYLALMVIPILVVAQIYYGSFLPNTFYAKSVKWLTNIDVGAIYLVRFLKAQAVLAIALVVVALFHRRLLSSPLRALGIIVAVFGLHVTVQGGDNMVGHRALLPVLPLLYVLVMAALSRYKAVVAVLVALPIVAYNLYAYNSGWVMGGSWDMTIQEQSLGWRDAYPRRVKLATHLKENFPPETVVALNAAGIIPYYSELPTIDMLGLNNAPIARHGRRDNKMPYGHQAGDGRHVLDERPGVIIFGGLGRRDQRFFLSDREIWASYRFRNNYEYVDLTSAIRLFVRKPKR